MSPDLCAPVGVIRATMLTPRLHSGEETGPHVMQVAPLSEQTGSLNFAENKQVSDKVG